MIVRLMGGWRVAGLLASFALSVSVFYWRRMIIAESYGPAAGMLSVVWLAVLLWRQTDKWGWLFLAGLAGHGLAHTDGRIRHCTGQVWRVSRGGVGERNNFV